MKPHLDITMEIGLLLTALTLLIATVQAQDVRVPPSITLGPDRYVGFKVGQEITLPCEATGTPEPEFEWHFNGDLFDKNTPGVVWNKGSMTITSTTANYQGEWQCFAYNQHGKSMSAFAQLEMHTIANYPPGKTVKDYQASQGEKLKLICDNLKSVPAASFSWSNVKDATDSSAGQVVEITDRIQIDDQGNLLFANIQLSDGLNGRLYKCNIYNPSHLVTVGGSLSRIIVAPGSPAPKRASLEYSTVSPSTALKTKSISLKCIFSGNSSPRVQWTKVSGSLPFGRHTITNSGSTLNLERIEETDEGEYKCSGSNAENVAEHIIQLVVDSEPVFTTNAYKPMNTNGTEGETEEFKCLADAEPRAEVTWYINGDKVDRANAGPRRSISQDGLQLTVTKLCKDCLGEGSHTTDLMNIQCMARNKHNYAFADAYLNVLRRTTLTVKPEDVTLEFGSEVLFKCQGTSDDLTPITYKWQFNDIDVEIEAGKTEILEDNTLKLITEDDDDAGKHREGKYTCYAMNGYSEDKAEAQLTLPPVDKPLAGASMADLWWVFLIVALILLLLILIFCCCLCCQRNRGDSYPVDEKERAQGNDPEKELENDGYHDYQRPEDAPIKGSRASLTSTIKLDSDDEGSLNEYGGDLDTGKFNEDGSFIGQYIEKDKKRPKDSEV